MLTIWGRINSHNVKKVVWLAEELGLPYVRHDVGGAFGMDSDYLVKNPNALIPAIDDGEISLWESNSILRYLAAQYGAPHFWSESAAVRAIGDKWMDWQISFSDQFRPVFFGLIRTAPADRDMAAISAAVDAVNKAMTILNGELEKNEWLSGDSFGIGDIPMGAYTHTYFSLPIDRPNLPSLSNWYKRLTERNAYRKVVMIPLT